MKFKIKGFDQDDNPCCRTLNPKTLSKEILIYERQSKSKAKKDIYKNEKNRINNQKNK